MKTGGASWGQMRRVLFSGSVYLDSEAGWAWLGGAPTVESLEDGQVPQQRRRASVGLGGTQGWMLAAGLWEACCSLGLEPT